MADPIPDAYWIRGINSILEPTLLKEGEYQWAVNVNNAGGIIQTRSGFNCMTDPTTFGIDGLEPRGMTFFKDRNGITNMVVVVGSEIWATPYPFKFFVKIGEGLGLKGRVTFCRVVRSVVRDITTGGLTVLPTSIPYLVMQGDGARAAIWDGITFTAAVDPTDDGDQSVPIGTWMQWSNGRLFVADGSDLHASDLGDPLTFYEERQVAGGGTIAFQDEITGLFQTPDLKNLLVATDFNTSVVQTGIVDRTQWALTNDFVKVLLPGIGCAAGDSFCHQYGMTWWYAHGGLVRLDSALNTYRTSKITFQDQLMMRAKANLNSDIRGIVIRAFGNYLLIAAPSGSGANNPEIWVMNQTTLQTGEDSDSQSWVGKWTGLNIASMAVTVVNGEQRVFALSKDRTSTGGFVSEFSPNVWELFMGEREDISQNKFAQRIKCLWQSRFLGMSSQLKKFTFAEIELAEGKGVVDMQVFVTSRRGGFHKIMDKKLSFTEGNVNASITSPVTAVLTQDVAIGDGVITIADTTGFLDAPSSIFVDGEKIDYIAKDATTFTVVGPSQAHLKGAQVTQPQFKWGPNADDPKTIFKSYTPQRRMLRTSGWTAGDLPDSCPVESIKTDNIDRAFSILIKWTGRVAISGVWLFAEPQNDYTMGRCEADEDKARSVDDSGTGILSPNIIQPVTSHLHERKQRYLRNITPLPIEDEYNSFVL